MRLLARDWQKQLTAGQQRRRVALTQTALKSGWTEVDRQMAGCWRLEEITRLVSALADRLAQDAEVLDGRGA